VIPPNIWQDNFLTGSTPFAVYPRVNAAKSGEIAYGFQITPDELPPTYTPDGVNILASGDPKKVPANTVMDVNRYQRDLAALAPGHQLSLLNLSAVDRGFGNATLHTWTLGLERTFGGLTADAAYVGTTSSRLPRVSYPNAYPGANPGFAPFTDFDNSGAVTGGFVLGVLEALSIAYAPRAVTIVLPVLIILVVLMIRPAGLFGRLSAQRA